jgi:hypothetical protein
MIAAQRVRVAHSHSETTAFAMQQFIEMTGKTLLRVVSENELTPGQLRECGVREDSLVRVNPQGDIELRRRDRWDVIGGLLGEFEARLRHETGLEWA